MSEQKDSRSLQDLVHRLPKSELHLHLEGTLEPDMLLQLAERNRIFLPYDSVEAIRRAYAFTDLASFLRLYYQGMSVLCREADFHELTMAYLRRAKADGVVHAEVFFDPQAHVERGIPFEEVIEGIHSALENGAEELGITYRLILCFLRDRPPHEAAKILHQAKPYLPWLSGVGLDSAEHNHPPEWFMEVFEQARSWGLHAVAHAGEEGPAAYIRQALDVLHVERIDHGVRCEEDPTLMMRLARERIPLTVCPLSNVKLGVFARLEDHNLGRLLRHGLCVTVNSDDPAYFGGYVGDNLLETARALRLDAHDIATLCRNSLEASFLTPDERHAHTNQLASIMDSWGHG